MHDGWLGSNVAASEMSVIRFASDLLDSVDVIVTGPPLTVISYSRSGPVSGDGWQLQVVSPPVPDVLCPVSTAPQAASVEESRQESASVKFPLSVAATPSTTM